MNTELSLNEWLSKNPFPHQSHEDIIDKYYNDLLYVLKTNNLKLNIDKTQFLKYFQHFIYTHSDINIKYNHYYYNENDLKDNDNL